LLKHVCFGAETWYIVTSDNIAPYKLSYLLTYLLLTKH